MRKLLLITLLLASSVHAQDFQAEEREEAREQAAWQRQLEYQEEQEQTRLIEKQNKLIEENNQLLQDSEHRARVREIDDEIDKHSYKSIYDRR